MEALQFISPSRLLAHQLCIPNQNLYNTSSVLAVHTNMISLDVFDSMINTDRVQKEIFFVIE